MFFNGRKSHDCMSCPKQHELNSLRAFKERVESDAERQKLLDETEAYKTRLNSEKEKSERWKKARDEAENAEKEARKELREVTQEKDNLKKQLASIQERMEKSIEKAVQSALKEANREFSESVSDLNRAHRTEMQEAADAVKAEMQAEINQLQAQVREKNQLIQKLEAALHQEKPAATADGTNSGTPTSQTPIGKKKVIPATQRGQGKTKGGQPGHPGHFAKLFEDDDPDVQTEKHYAEKVCPCCGKPLVHKQWIPKDTLDVKIIVTKHRDLYEEAECECGNVVRAVPPRSQSGTLHYGPMIQSILLYLMVVGNMPMEKAVSFVTGITDGKGNPAASYAAKLAPRASENLKPFLDDLYLLTLSQQLLYWDDTVTMVNTHRACLRFYGTENFSFYRAHWTKARCTLDEDQILALLDETVAVMHDHCSVNYNPDFMFMNLDCAVHLIRAIEKVKQNSNHAWADDLLKHIRGAIHDRHIWISENKTSFDEAYLTSFFSRYEEILKQGDEQCDADKNRYFHDEEETLLLRLRNYTANYFAWVTCFDFPITDNLSERGLRRVKTRLKVSGQFETLDAMEDYAAITSYLDTCRKCGKQELDALERLLSGDPYTLAEILPQEEIVRMNAFRGKVAHAAANAEQEESNTTPSAKTEPMADADSCVGETRDEAQTTDSDTHQEKTSGAQYREILAFLSKPHSVHEMIPILTARGDAKHLFRKGGESNEEADKRDVILGEEADESSGATSNDPKSSNAKTKTGAQKSRAGKKGGKQKSGSDSNGNGKKNPREADKEDIPSWARRHKKKPIGRPKKVEVKADVHPEENEQRTGTDG